MFSMFLGEYNFFLSVFTSNFFYFTGTQQIPHPFGFDNSSKKDSMSLVSNLLTEQNSASLRNQERLDSSSEDQAAIEIDTKFELSSQSQGFEPSQGATALSATSGISGDAISVSGPTGNDTEIREKPTSCQGNVCQTSLDLSWLVENPAFLAACYCLALLHQLGGLDFLSLLGMVLAMTSMVSMFFL